MDWLKLKFSGFQAADFACQGVESDTYPAVSGAIVSVHLA